MFMYAILLLNTSLNVMYSILSCFKIAVVWSSADVFCLYVITTKRLFKTNWNLVYACWYYKCKGWVCRWRWHNKPFRNGSGLKNWLIFLIFHDNDWVGRLLKLHQMEYNLTNMEEKAIKASLFMQGVGGCLLPFPW